MFFTFLSMSAIAADQVEISEDLKIRVNILKPICKLTSSSNVIDFGEFNSQDFLQNQPTAGTTFFFDDCSTTNYFNIDFVGGYIDQTQNYINLSRGENYASGVAIKLYDKNDKEINLKDTYSVNTNGSQKVKLDIRAKVVTLHEGGVKLKPGDLKSSVTLVISYG